MKITGNLKFERRPDGSIDHEWTGGRRIAVSSGLLETLTETRPYVGQVVKIGNVRLRLVDFYYDPATVYMDSYVAMRDGLLARFASAYVLWLHAHAANLFKWECRWIRRRESINGEMYPKWSLPGILLRPLL